MYCLGLFVVVYIKYDNAHLVMDIHSPTEFHDYTLFSFLVMGIESEEDEKLSQS